MVIRKNKVTAEKRLRGKKKKTLLTAEIITSPLSESVKTKVRQHVRVPFVKIRKAD